LRWHTKHTQTVIDATQNETATDQQQHSCETLVCQRHQTILRLLPSAATARKRWRVRELYFRPRNAHRHLHGETAKNYEKLQSLQAHSVSVREGGGLCACVCMGLFWDYLSTSLQWENLASNGGTNRRSKITSFAVYSEITNMIRQATTKSESWSTWKP